MPDFASHPDAARHSSEGFRLDGWTVRPRAHELARGAEVVRVEPKPMDVLVCLAARAGHTVTRDELLDAVWPDVFVSESTLSRCVSQLRKVFGDDPQAPRVIETIPRSGYRLIAPVTPLAEGDGLAPAFEGYVTLDLAPPEVAPPAQSSATAPGSQSPRVPVGQWLGGLAVFVLALALTVLVGRAGLTGHTGPSASASLAVVPFDLEPGVASSATWSPDGSRVAYVRTTREGDRLDAALLVRMAADTPPLRLDDGTARVAAPAWSPDGTEVAYVRCDADGCRPYAAPALGGLPRRLADVPVSPASLAWVSDEALVVSPRSGSGAHTGADAARPTPLARLDLRTGTLHPLTNPPPAARGDWMPTMSPDGRWLAFERHTAAGGQDLYRLDLAAPDTPPERLTHDDADIAGFTWTPNSRALILSSNRAGVYALWRLLPETTAMERVATVPARDPGGPALAEGVLVFEEWLFEINLWRHDLADLSAEPERVVASSLWDMHPHERPDGRLAFVSNRSGPPEVWLADADGANVRRRTDLGGPAVESPRWNPDGQRMVMQTRQDERAVLMLLDVEGGPAQALTTPDADARHPRWTRNGRHVLFASNRGGAWHLWRVAPGGGLPARIVGTEGAVVGAEGPDGALLVARYGEPGLWRLDPDAAGVTPTSLLADLADPLAWTVAGDAIVYVARTDVGHALVRWEPRTGRRTERPVGPLQLLPGAPVLTASPDGRTVVLAQVDHVESDLMRVDGFE